MSRILAALLPRRREAERDPRLYAQLPYIAYTTLALALLFLALEGVLAVNGLMTIVAALSVDLVSVVLGIAFLRRGLHRAASALTTIALGWASIAFLLLMPYVGNNARETYRGLAFAAVLAAINAAVSLDRKQIWLYACAFGLAWLGCFATIFRHYLAEDGAEYLSILFAGSLGFVFETVMLLLVRSLSDRLLEGAATQRRKSEEAYARLTELLAEAREGMSIGDRVVGATEKAAGASREISRMQEYLGEESKRLSVEADSLQASSRSALEGIRRIEEALESQNAATLETSSALAQINQNIDSIDKVASGRRALLAEAAKAGEDQRRLIESLAKAFASVRESSEGIRRFTETVQDIASRTSLLSMNASIEAARAGASGRGFAVVAQEIRSLSTETQRNSELIAESIGRNEATVAEAGVLVAEFSDFVAKNIESDRSLIAAIDEILGGISEMHSGLREVSGAMREIVEGMQASKEKALDMASRIEAQQDGFEHLARFAAELDSRIAALRDAAQEILSATSSAAEAGRLNIEQVKRLQG